jgi:hypothetical protein
MTIPTLVWLPAVLAPLPLPTDAARPDLACPGRDR